MATKASKVGTTAHTAGIFADMSLDGPEIGTLVAVIDRARNLPNRRTMGKQDPYCAMRLGKEAKKTETDRRGGQTPKWDQELRFRVHESPDYYRLKCSIFNDDKKTDLIGEAWIDLRETIVPGGSQSDRWHQLQFKGKYAGEVRIEMTYYDSRPQDDIALAKKQEREKRKQAHGNGATAVTVGGPRQLGPRDVKRRPLPASPGELMQPSPPVTPDSLRPSTQTLPSNLGYLHQDPISGPNQTNSHDAYVPHDPYQYEDGYDNQSIAHGQPPRAYSSNMQSIVSVDNNRQNRSWSQPDALFKGQSDAPYSFDTNPTHHNGAPRQWSEPMATSEAVFPHPSTSDNLSPSRSSTCDTVPAHRPLPPQQRDSMSPTKTTLFRDSPLRQSMSQQDTHDHQLSPPPSPERGQPPPPPEHGNSTVSHAHPYHGIDSWQTPQRPQAQRNHPRQYAQPLIDDRSPLQPLEQNSWPQAQPAPVVRPSSWMDSQTHQISRRDGQFSPYDMAPRKHNSGSGPENMPPNRWTERFDDMPRMDEPDQYDAGFQRRSGGPDQLPRRAQLYDNRGRNSYPGPDPHQEQVFRSRPQVYRPPAVSPDQRHRIPRKSVSPQPMPQEASSANQGAPFSPDSYDALLPASSPAGADNYAYKDQPTPQEAARQREVDKIRDQGAIIGNDGRVIDPSDHLPADTWAPEPDRKTKKPEVIIRFKTKDESNRRSDLGSSANSARPLPSSPYPTSPDSSRGQPHSAPSPSRSGPNRLQKPMSSRPLPFQPLPHSQSSPTVTTRHSVYEDRVPQTVSRPDLSLHSHYSTPAPQSGGQLPRPQLSEYTGSPMQAFGSSPRESPYYGGRGGAYFEEPMHNSNLGFDYSSIDIGQSRYGR